MKGEGWTSKNIFSRYTILSKYRQTGRKTDRYTHTKSNFNLNHRCTRLCHDTPLLIDRGLFMAPCLLNPSILSFPSLLYIWLELWRNLSVSSSLCLSSPFYHPPFPDQPSSVCFTSSVFSTPSYSLSLWSSCLLPLACFMLFLEDGWSLGSGACGQGLDKRRENGGGSGGEWRVSQSGRP